jgi:transposase
MRHRYSRVELSGEEEDMMERLIVAPRKGVWEVRPESGTRFTSLHRTRDLAVRTARREAEKKKATVRVLAEAIREGASW